MAKRILNLLTALIMVVSLVGVMPVLANDEGSINNPIALATNNQWQNGHIGDNNEYESDYYSVNVPSDGKLTINMQSFGELEFYILDSSFSELNCYYDYFASAGNPSNFEFSEWLKSGIYYLQIKNLYSTSSGDYRLKASFESANSNEIEPNDSYLQAQPLSNGSVIIGTMLYNNDYINKEYDYYKIDLTKKTNCCFILTTYKFSADFTLYDNDLNDITSKELSGDYEYSCYVYDGSISLNFSLDKGTYYVRIEGIEDTLYASDIDGKYTLKFTTSSVSKSDSSKSTTSKKSKAVKKSKSSAKKLAKVSGVKKIKLTRKKVKILWKKVSGAKGYQVKWASNSKFKKAKNKFTIKRKITLKRLKNKKCFVKVRAYKIVKGNKTYGKWSNVVKVK